MILRKFSETFCCLLCVQHLQLHRARRDICAVLRVLGSVRIRLGLAVNMSYRLLFISLFVFAPFVLIGPVYVCVRCARRSCGTQSAVRGVWITYVNQTRALLPEWEIMRREHMQNEYMCVRARATAYNSQH